MNFLSRAGNTDDKYWDRQIETLPREKLREIQEDRLRKQLEYVYRFSPFYRDIFARNKFHPNDFKSLDDLQRIPITYKDELRKAVLTTNNPLPHLCAPRDSIAGFGCSRGTTGEPT